MSGRTDSPNNIASGGFQNTIGGSLDAYLVKFDGSTGNLVWSTYYGGTGDDDGYVATDLLGNVFLAGRTDSPTGISSGGFQNNIGGLNDAFLVKFNALTGARIWASYYGDTGYDTGYGVATDNSGNAYVVGVTYSSSNISLGGFQNTNGGNGDAYLVKFDGVTGNRSWATYYGALGSDLGLDVAADAFGNVYMAGIAGSGSTTLASGGFQNTIGSGPYDDLFLVKFNALTGTRSWATYYGGAFMGAQEGKEERASIAIDPCGNVYLAGDIYSHNMAHLGFQNTLNGSENTFVVKFDPSGNRVCATYYGEWHEEIGRVAVDKAGDVYIAAQSQNFGPGNLAYGGFQNSIAGGAGADAILVKISNALSVGNTNVSCHGNCVGTATVTPQGCGPYIYSWNTIPAQTTQVATGLCAGSYTVSVTNSVGVITTETVSIAQPSASLSSTVTTTNVKCNNECNGSVTLNASGGTIGYAYSWNTVSSQTTANATGLCAGNYTCTITDGNLCLQTQTVSIAQPSLLTATAVPTTTILCNGGTASATINVGGGTGPYAYSWNNNSTNISVTGLGVNSYTCLITDLNNCVTTTTISFTQPTPLTLTPNLTTNVLCNGGNTGSASVIPGGGTNPYNYSWSLSGGTNNPATGLAAGTYTVTVTDKNNCVQTNTISITETSAIIINHTSNPDTCSNGLGSASVIVGGGAGIFSYSWSNGNTNTINTALSSGKYNIVITDLNNCTKSEIVVIANLVGPTADAGSYISINKGDQTILNGSGGISYSWSPEGSLSCSTCASPTASPTQTTTYILVVTDANGCTSSDSITVNVKTECGDVFIPNAFSPNGDGENDILKIFVDETCIKKIHLIIFDRWGETVFETNDQNGYWNGIFKGKQMDTDVYFYTLIVEQALANSIIKKGNINLIR